MPVLSFAQEQLWFLDRLTPGTTTYNILMVWRLRGPLRVDVLQRCLTLVVARHESLRATIRDDDGRPYQVVAPAAEVPLPVTDLRGLPEAERERRVWAEIDAQRSDPYDLAAGPLCRFRLLQLDDEEYVFCEGVHHIVTDGWSIGILNADLSAAYRSLCAGAEPVFADRDLDYTEYAEAQRERLSGDALAEELSYWRDLLAGVPVVDLPADRPRPGGSHRGDTVSKDFPADLRGVVQQLADDHHASVFMVLTAAFTMLVSRYSGQEDIPTGIPMLGRPEPELESVVGMFTNMVVLRSDLSGDPTFSELIDRTADRSLELYDHQEVSFHQVVEALQPPRDGGRNPLFQVSIQVLGDSTSGEGLDLPGVAAEFVPLRSADSRFDIAATVVDTGSSLRAAVEYSTDLYDRWRIEAMLVHLEAVLHVAAVDPGVRLSAIPTVTAAEADELLAAGRGELVPYDPQPLHAAVAAVARQQPDAVAVVCDGAELSYRELDRRADRLARDLRAEGLRRGDVVAVVLEENLDAYVTVLAVAKAGGTSAVLDPGQPLARGIDDVAATLVVTRAGLADQLSGRRVVLVDTDRAAVDAAEPLAEWATADLPACVLRTSDSAGGVLVSHRAVSSFCAAYRRVLDVGAGDRLLHVLPLSAGTAQGELWTGWLSGATVVAASPKEAAAPQLLSALIRDQRVTHAALPPAVQSVLDPAAFPDLRQVVTGVPVPPELINAWNTGSRRYLILYGPPESAIACTAYECERVEWRAAPPVGRPLGNRQVYVVDRSMNLAPRGVPGELLVGGEPGTLAEPGAGRWVDDPFHPGRPVHRTGDLVRWNSDLQLEFLGRVDDRDAAGAVPDAAGSGDSEPRTPTEQSVADIFGHVLSLPAVGAEDSFFDVGGNSLQAMRAVSRINKGFGIKLSVRTLYGNFSVRAVSAVVDEMVGGTPASDD